MDIKNKLLEALMGKPEQVVNTLGNTTSTNYYEPLAQQVDYLNENQDLMPEAERKIWNKIGYDKIRRNAEVGKNSGFPRLENARVNLGLLANQPINQVSGGLEAIPAKSGFLTDMASGYRDNLNNSFQVQNLVGNNKGIGTRLGEGLGTLVRTLDKPVGRAAIAYGLTKALGGGNDISAVNALTAGVTNQTLRTQDEVYRRGLEEQGLDTSNLRGYVTDDLYKNYSNSYYKLRDLERREQTAQVYNEFTRLKAEEQEIKNSALPEMQKAKLIQENAKAQYAVQMQLAKIKALENTAALGWGRLGIQQEGLNLEKEKQAMKQQEEQAKIDALKSLTGGGSNLPNKIGGRAF